VNRELIINSHPTEVDIVLLEDKRLVELHKEKRNNNYIVGDIYLGRVRKIIPGLNAAFIDVGYEKDAFLHYLDLGPKVTSLIKLTKLALNGKLTTTSLDSFTIEKDIEKLGKISNILTVNQPVLVQIAKEPISTKGPRIGSELAFPGRYMVLVPFSDRISVSQKIKSPDERSRLKRLAQSIKPKNFGLIIRTLAENKNTAELDNDLRDLIEKWNDSIKKIYKAKPPQKIFGEMDRASTILRDLLNESFNSIHVNDNSLFEYIKGYIKNIAPDKVDIVKLYKNKTPILENFGIEKQIKTSFGKTVSLRNGAYLVIEHTEALHVIDVNSGHKLRSESSQELNALEVNMDAANEIARQIRLRDLGGIIVIDFIDMRDINHKKMLFEKVQQAMSVDRARHTILPVNRFGLIHITRQRVRPEMNIDILEKCPVCDGTGQIKASIILIDEIEGLINYLIKEQNQPYIKMTVHPYVYAYLTKGLFSIKFKWFFRFKKWIKIFPMSSYHFLEYHFFDKNGEEIKI
jgi:ribonuclease G